MLEGLPCLLENIIPPDQQLLAEIIALAIVHERLFVGRPIGPELIRTRTHIAPLPRANSFFLSATSNARRPYIASPRRLQSRRRKYMIRITKMRQKTSSRRGCDVVLCDFSREFDRRFAVLALFARSANVIQIVSRSRLPPEHLHLVQA